jgi:hypothetical protein
MQADLSSVNVLMYSYQALYTTPYSCLVVLVVQLYLHRHVPLPNIIIRRIKIRSRAVRYLLLYAARIQIDDER